MLSNISVRTFSGKDVQPYLLGLARLRTEVFRDWPYLIDTNADFELQALKNLAEKEDSLFIVIFDGSTMVGVSTGIPLRLADPSIQKPFLEQKHPINDYFYCGESLLLKPYRGRGIAHHFFDHREAQAKKLSCKYTCFRCVERTVEHPQRPLDQFPFDEFWKKRGYVHQPQMVSLSTWKDVDQSQESEKSLVFWIKNLSER